MNWIIKVDNLSKVYRIGSGATQHGTLYEQISKRVKSYFPEKKIDTKEDIDDESSSKLIVSKEQTEGLPPGYFWALKDISFEVSPGERIGLIGQNGSGKSTLLKILSRITTQSHGEFRYRGHLISLLEVGTGFHPELSGRENIYLNASINGMSRQQIKARFKSIVDFSELGSQIDTPVKRYSSGMYMRLAFSVAAFLESEILLIDEVLAVGDSDFQKKCKEKMLELANDGRSVIFVSHDMSAIESICKKTIEISHGKIIEIKDIVVRKKEESDKEGNQNSEIEKKPILLNLERNSRIELCAERNWDLDSIDMPYINGVVQMHSCKLLNDEGRIQEKFTVDENININIRFKVLNSNSRLVLRIDLASLDGIKICSSMDHHLFNFENASRDSGLYDEVVSIPKEYLNEGQFLISVYISDLHDSNISISSSNCLSMKIIDNYLPTGVRSNWVGAWPESLLRPKLSWKLEHYCDEEKILESDSI